MAKQQQTFIHHFCPECGGKMSYKGGNRQLACGNCNYSRNLHKNSDQVSERGLTGNVSFKTFTKGMSAPDLLEFTCGGCSSKLAVIKGHELENCPYCGHAEFEASEQHKSVLMPTNIIPFTVPEKRARKKLKRWLRKGNWMFLPNDLFKLANPEHLKGVFIPYFMVDAFVRSSWKGKAGFNYEVNNRGKKERRTNWEDFAGYWEHFFEGMSVVASKGIHEGTLEKILPYNTRELVSYDADYLKDWFTEIYQKDEMSALEIAETIMEAEVEIRASRRIRGDEIKDLKFAMEKMLLTFKHVLFPVWVGTYTYRGKTFQYLINGQTGEIAGTKPLSMEKMIITVAAGIALIAALVLFIRW